VRKLAPLCALCATKTRAAILHALRFGIGQLTGGFVTGRRQAGDASSSSRRNQALRFSRPDLLSGVAEQAPDVAK